MEIFYSLSLLVSLAAGTASILLGLAAYFSLSDGSPQDGAHPGAPKASRLVRYATDAFALGGVAGLVSLAVHWGWEHGANAVEPMTAGALLRAHPSSVLAGLLVAVGAVLVLAARSRIASRAGHANLRRRG